MKSPDLKVFNMYLDTEKGKEMTNLFTLPVEAEDTALKIEKIFTLVKDNFRGDLQNLLNMFFVAEDSISLTMSKMSEEELNAPDDIDFFNAFLQKYEFGYTEDGKEEILIPHDKERELATTMPYLSLALYVMMPETFIYPILAQHNFTHFVECCQYLGIEIPQIPPQKDKFERMVFMFNLSIAIENFAIENELTKEQTCALIYGWAHEYLTTEDGESEAALPAPTRIWFTGASKADVKYGSLDEEHPVWACNEETKRGDIVIIYALAPHSCIHSIWRATKDGSVNPFDQYTNRVEVGNKIEVPHITFDELKADEKLKECPIVKNNLNGINGREMAYQDYQNLLEMIARKGFDISVLPNIEAPAIHDDENVVLEKDVSERQLIPLLVDLGYAGEDGVDWKQELVLKLGRDREVEETGYKARPDFTFFPSEEELGQKSAPFLIEVKFLMKNNQERQSATSQAFSYGRQLNAKLVGVCDKEIFRVYKVDKNGSFRESGLIFDHSWSELKNPEIFNELKKKIGRDVIIRLK